MADDWRVEVELQEPGAGGLLREHLESHELTGDVRARLGSHVVVSDDGDKLFLYVDSPNAAAAAASVVDDAAHEHGWHMRTDITHWHEIAEDWEPAGTGDAATVEEQQAEHARLMQRERDETAAQGYADWEVRVQFAEHGEARELSERLDREGVAHVRHWKYLLVGATDEDAAHAWAERLRGEAPPDAQVRVEGTFTSAVAHNPWRYFEELGGGP